MSPVTKLMLNMVYTGIPSQYLTLLCDMPHLIQFPRQACGKPLVSKFAHAVTSGVVACVQLANDMGPYSGQNRQTFSDVAEV